MLAAHSTFDMTSTRAQIEVRAFETKFGWLYHFRSVIRWCFSDEPLRFILERLMAKMIESAARDLEKRTTSFKGFAHAVGSRLHADADSDLEVLQLVDSMVEHTTDLHLSIANVISKRQRRGAKSAAIGQALSRIEAAASELLKAVEFFRLAVLRDATARGTFHGHREAIKYFELIDPEFAKLCEVAGKFSAQVERLATLRLDDADMSLLSEARGSVNSMSSKQPA